MNPPASAQSLAALRRLVRSDQADEFASDLGHLLSEAQLDSDGARELRLECAKAAKRHSSAETAAQLRFCATLLTAFERSRRAEEEKAGALSDLHPEDEVVLRRLNVEPATPSELCGGKDNGSTSKRLKRLQERGLVETIAGQDGRTRPRLLTTLGHLVVARLEARQQTQPPRSSEAQAPAETATPRELVGSTIECTLRVLKAAQTSRAAAPITRSEVGLMIPRELHPHGFSESFERFAEGLDLVDIDARGGYCDPRWRERSSIWTELFASLADATACRRVFASLKGQNPQLMTVASRRDAWLEVVGPLDERIDVVTLEELSREPKAAVGILVVDDPTLAESVASYEGMAAVKVKTLDSSADGPPILRSVPPRQVASP